jgi:hypothetical protein
VQPPPIMPWCGGPQVPYGLMFWLQDANTARAVNNCVMPQWFKQMPPSGHGGSASGHSASGHSASGHSASGHSASGHSASGHSASGHSASGHSASGHSASGHSASGHSAGGHSAAVENSSASFFLHDQGAALGNMVAFTVMIALLVVVIALASVLVHKAVTT